MYSEYAYTSLMYERAELLQKLDCEFLRMLNSYKVNNWVVPALIDGKILERCGYFSTIPNHLTKVGFIKRARLQVISNNSDALCCDDFDNSANLYMTPAACLHLYPIIENNPVCDEIITTFARVYRYEDDDFVQLERQWDFTVREFVAVGSAEYVKKFLAYMEHKLSEYALKYSDKVSVVEAHDHFYPTKNNRLKERFQHKNNLKRELTVNCGESKLAISSFNYHEFHFSKVFNFDDNGKIVTGCVGCGLERWIRFLEEQNDFQKRIAN